MMQTFYSARRVPIGGAPRVERLLPCRSMNEADILLSQIDGVGFCGSKFPEFECARWVESPICTPCEIYGRNLRNKGALKRN